MENKNYKGLVWLVVILIILVIALMGFIVYGEFSNKSTNETNQTTENKTVTDDNQISNNKTNTDTANTYKIDKIKIVQNSYNDNDTKLVKAQKIAKEVMNAVNNKDYYYLAKMVGNDADNFVEYGIHNYSVNINDYEELDGEFIFKETYDWDKTKLNSLEEISLGTMLIIQFEDGGRVIIDPNCTGV